MGGTCWANAYAAAILRTNKRILGRKTETFETYRENLIKYACEKYTDGAHIMNDRVRDYFESIKLNINKVINVRDAKNAIMKGHFVVCYFCLNKTQWDNFDNFFEKPKQGVLTKEEINKNMEETEDMEETQEDIDDACGHAVLLIDVKSDYLEFLNSWGPKWADNGKFKVKNADVLKPYYSDDYPKFYEISYSHKDISKEEIDYFEKNFDNVSQILNNLDEITLKNIISYYNDLSKDFFIYYNRKCCKKIKLDYCQTYIEKGNHKIICPFCGASNNAEGRLKELLILKNLMHDGNEDFDINYEEKDYLDINRIEFHKNFEKALINESDICTLGLVKLNGKYIDSLFEKNINSIINLKDNIFMASGSGFILVFMLNNNCFKCLMEKYIPDDDLFSLCDLRGNNLIASGGNNLKIFKINYEINFLTLVETFNNNKKINKIILLEPKTPGDSKKMAVCDQNGYIGIYDIIDNEIVLYFNKKCHNSYINCILYLPDDEMLVSGSNGGGILKFWEIGDKCLKLLDSKKIPSTIYNGGLLDIKGYLLVGEKKMV